jgi:hypothetical protein
MKVERRGGTTAWLQLKIQKSVPFDTVTQTSQLRGNPLLQTTSACLDEKRLDKIALFDLPLHEWGALPWEPGITVEGRPCH